MLVKEITYMILDLLKATSDDSFFTEDHIIFLIKKYRSFLIRKEMEKQRTTGELSEFEFQQICLDLEKVPAIDGQPCTGGYYLRTVSKIPKLLEGIQPRVYPFDFYQGIHISFVPRDKMRYIGTNKFLRNILYVSIGPDNHLYLNSSNPQFFYLKKLRMSAVFEDFDEASELLCDNDEESKACDVLEEEFPMRQSLVPTLVELVIKELTEAVYKPIDERNNAGDDLSKVSTKQS